VRTSHKETDAARGVGFTEVAPGVIAGEKASRPQLSAWTLRATGKGSVSVMYMRYACQYRVGVPRTLSVRRLDQVGKLDPATLVAADPCGVFTKSIALVAPRRLPPR